MCLMTVDTEEILAEGLTLEQLGAVMKIKALSMATGKIPEQSEIVEALIISETFLGELITAKASLGESLHEELVSQSNKINHTRSLSRVRKQNQRANGNHQKHADRVPQNVTRDIQTSHNNVTRDMEKGFLKTFHSNLTSIEKHKSHVTRDTPTSHNALAFKPLIGEKMVKITRIDDNSCLETGVTRDIRPKNAKQLCGVYINKTLNSLNLHTEPKDNTYIKRNTNSIALLSKKTRLLSKKPVPDIVLDYPPEIDADTLKASCREIFEQLWKMYPRKYGKKEAFRHYRASVKHPEQFRLFCAALSDHKRQMSREHRGPKHIPYGSTWFNDWEDSIPENGLSRPEQRIAAMAVMDAIEERMKKEQGVTLA